MLELVRLTIKEPLQELRQEQVIIQTELHTLVTLLGTQLEILQRTS